MSASHILTSEGAEAPINNEDTKEPHRHPFHHDSDDESAVHVDKEAGQNSNAISSLSLADSVSHPLPSLLPPHNLHYQAYGKLKASDSSVPGPHDAHSIHTDTDTTPDPERDHESDSDSMGSSRSDMSATSMPSRGVSEKTADQRSATYSETPSDASVRFGNLSVSSSSVQWDGREEGGGMERNGMHSMARHTMEEKMVPIGLRDSSGGSDMTSISMPDLMSKMEKGPEVLEVAKEGEEGGKKMVSLRSGEDGEDGGVVEDGEEKWEDDDERRLLGRGEEEEEDIQRRRSVPFVQTLRPIQVRRMPLLFHILMILSISMIGFGSYAGYDAVAAVQEALMKDMSLTPSQFGLLYSVYALPNIILVIFGGKLVDVWGSHVVGLITTASIAFGAGLVAIAPSLHFLGWYGRFGTMLFGRFIFGVGAESSYVVQNSMCVKWFFGDRLATAMAITVAFTRLGSICSFVFAPGLAAKSNYTLALWAATAACVLSMFAVFAYILLRSYAKNYLLTNDFDANSLELVHSIPSDSESPRSRPSSDSIHLQDPDASDDSPIPLDSDELEMPIISSGNCLTKEVKLSWHHVRGFSSLFWGCAILGMLTYGISLGFRAVSSDAIATRYNYSPSKTNLVLASIDITGLFASPVIGWIVDYTYQMGWITLVGNGMSVLTFMLLLPLISPYPATVLLGISSTIVPATIYPAISYLTQPSLEGFAFGITSSIINLGNLLLNYAIGRTLDAGWFYMCGFLIFLSILSVAITLWWIIKDSKQETPILNPFRDWSSERQWLHRHLPFLFH